MVSKLPSQFFICSHWQLKMAVSMEATILYSHVGIKDSWAFTVNCSGTIVHIKFTRLSLTDAVHNNNWRMCPEPPAAVPPAGGAGGAGAAADDERFVSAPEMARFSRRDDQLLYENTNSGLRRTFFILFPLFYFAFNILLSLFRFMDSFVSFCFWYFTLSAMISGFLCFTLC